MNIRLISNAFIGLACIASFSFCTNQKSNTVTTNSVENVKKDSVITPKVPEWAAKKFRYNPSRTILSDLVHTKLEVKFDFEKKYLNGIATLTLSPRFYPQNMLELDAKGMDIHSVLLVNGNQTNPLTFVYNDKLKLNINLSKTFKKGENYTIQIKYTAKPDELPKGGSAAITSDKGLYFINPDGKEKGKPVQIWTQGETEAASCWFPTIDAPNVKSTQEMFITVDKKFTTLSNGMHVYTTHNPDSSITDYWKQDKPHAPYLFMMAVGEFAVIKDTWKGMEVNYLVEKSFKKYAKSIFGNTPEMLEFFSNKLGYPYPWDKYSQVVVRDYVSGAMENTSATIMMDALQVTNRELLDKRWDDIIAHELFHHWFGDLVTCESWANLPLNESFANYSEYLWEEYKYGKDAADFHNLEETEQYLRESQIKQEPLIRYYYNNREDMFDSHSYAKGGRILHMLRNYVGDEAFFKSLQLYLKTNSFKSAEIHNLRMAFEETTGEDLNWFFDQYFLKPGHADLEVKHTYDNGKLKVSVKQLQDSLYTPIYKIPTTIEYWVNGNKTIEKIEVSKSNQSFEFTVSSKPDLVLFDGSQTLLAEIAHEKSAQEFAYQYEKSDKFLARLNALVFLGANNEEKDQTIVHNTFVKALKDPFWALRDEALDYFTDHKNEDSLQVYQTLLAIAEKDSKPAVKAKAIKVLSEKEWAKPSLKSLVEKSLNDSAYSVVAGALYAANNLNLENKKAIFDKYEKESNLLIVEVLAEIYAEIGDSTKFNWFVEKIDQAQGVEKYYTLHHFSKFIQTMPLQTQLMAFDKMKVILQDSTELWYAKWGAFKSIGKMDKIENRLAYLKEVASTEIDDNLKIRYNRLIAALEPKK